MVFILLAYFTLYNGLHFIGLKCKKLAMFLRIIFSFQFCELPSWGLHLSIDLLIISP